MASMNPIIFIRISQQQFIQQLIDTGHIFMNPLFTHQSPGANAQRHDSLEGVRDNSYRENFTMQLSIDGENWKGMNVLKANFNNRQDLTGCYSYSLTAIRIEDIRNAGVFAPNPELTEFGDTYAIIRNTGEFLNRIDTQLNSLGYEFRRGFVRYYDETTNQSGLTLFHKKASMSHQMEYRYIVWAKDNPDHISIKIGDLSEIAEMYDQGIDRLRIKLPDGWG
jgi:hypothetical protein